MSREKEVLWRENKYEVMSHSENMYRLIQKSISEITLIELFEQIEQAKAIPKTKGSVTNTYQHIWGYFKKQATEEEKTKTFKLLEEFQADKENDENLWKWLASLTVKYKQPYLLQSSLIVKYIN